MTQRSKPK